MKQHNLIPLFCYYIRMNNKALIHLSSTNHTIHSELLSLMLFMGKIWKKLGKKHKLVRFYIDNLNGHRVLCRISYKELINFGLFSAFYLQFTRKYY